MKSMFNGNQRNNLKTLVIFNFPGSQEVISFKGSMHDLFTNPDVTVIENPKDKADLEKLLQGLDTQFGKVIINSHGKEGNQSGEMLLTQKGELMPVVDIIRMINQNNQNPKEIHLFACNIGSHFEEIEQKSNQYYQDIVASTNRGQRLFLHGDNKDSSKGANIRAIESTLENNSGSITNTILNSPDSLKVAVRNNNYLRAGSDINVFHNDAYFNQVSSNVVSVEDYASYLVDSIAKAQDFERDNGFEVDTQIDSNKFQSLSFYEKQDYMSRLLILDIMKISEEFVQRDAFKLVHRWRDVFSKNEVNIDYVDELGVSPLYVAVEYKHILIVKEFLKQLEADPNIVTNYGFTPLRRAVKDSNLKIVESLLKSPNLNPNIADKNGWTPLMSAAVLGRKEIVTAFLNNKKLDLDLVNKEGKTSLYLAVEAGHNEVVDLLIEKGVNVNSAAKSGFTPLRRAVEDSNLKIAESLLKSSILDPNIADKDGWTPLMSAAVSGRKDIVTALLNNKKLDLDLVNNEGENSLYVALRYGNTEVAELLIEKGANVNSAAEDGSTPLLKAVQNRSLKMVDYLLKYPNLDPNIADKNGWTPLMVAADRGLYQIVTSLLGNTKTDLKSVNNDGKTAMNLTVSGYIQKCLSEAQDRTEAQDRMMIKNAVIINDPERVQSLLKDSDKDPNIADKEGWTPLMFAAFSGRKEIVKVLLDSKKLKLDLLNVNGCTSLYLAAEMGHDEVVDLLIEKGANVNSAAKDGFTPLRRAVLDNNLKIVKSLLKSPNLDPNIADENGWTPLMSTANLGRKEIVRVLLDSKKLKLDLFNENGYTSLYLAAAKGRDEVLDLLIEKGANVNSAAKDGFTPLRRAVEDSNLKIAESLLKSSILDPNIADKDGWTPLMSAAFSGRKEIVTALLNNKKLDLDLVNKKEGETSLHLAAANGHDEVVDLLIEEGANVNYATKDGFTPLRRAVLENNLKIVESLLKSPNLDPNIADKNGWTPLMSAAVSGRKDIVTALLNNKKIKLDLPNNEGRTSLYLAAEKGHDEVVDLLIGKGANVNSASDSGFTPLRRAVLENNLKIVESLLKSPNLDPNIADKNGWTPLMSAADLGRKEIVDALLDRKNSKKSDLDLFNKEGKTSLYLAVEAGRNEIADLLIRRGVNVNSAAKDGSTPLMIAVKSDNKDLVKSLSNSLDIDPDIADKNGWTALMYATQNGIVDVHYFLYYHEANLDFTNNKGQTALSVSIDSGENENTEKLIKKGANPNSFVNGFTPLIIAAQDNNLDLLTILLDDQKTEPNFTQKDGWTPLMHAAYYGSKDAAECLLEDTRTIVSQVNNDGETAKEIAMRRGEREVLHLISNEIDRRRNIEFDGVGGNRKGFEQDRNPYFTDTVSNKFGSTKLVGLSQSNEDSFNPVAIGGRNGGKEENDSCATVVGNLIPLILLISSHVYYNRGNNLKSHEGKSHEGKSHEKEGQGPGRSPSSTGSLTRRTVQVQGQGQGPGPVATA